MINAPAAITARNAVCRRCSFDSDAVQAMKIGATPTGSMITVNVTNVVPMIVHSTARRYAPARSVAVEREVHVVLRAAGPAAAPTPPDRGEGVAHLSGDHPAAMARAVAVGLCLRVAAHAAAHVRILDRVDVDGEAVRVVGPTAGSAAPAARRRHR